MRCVSYTASARKNNSLDLNVSDRTLSKPVGSPGEVCMLFRVFKDREDA